ncbi:MAG: hypothetical protein H7X93_09820 [Sphingomonadaceae bacterium]|nr:hypothetical protein [Sphingomonadaceae bacterium]
MSEFYETMVNLLESQRRTLVAIMALGDATSEKTAEMKAEIAKLDTEIAELRIEAGEAEGRNSDRPER